MDWNEIVDNLQDDAILHLMRELGVENYVDKPDYFIFPTICHHEDADEASLKLYYYKNTHRFMCYSEDGAMSPFTFLKHYYEIRGIEYDWYSDIYQVICNCSTYKANRSFMPTYKSKRDKYQVMRTPDLQEYPKGILDVFTKLYPIEWLNDGISEAAMDKYNILYSNSQNKIIIPHYDINGRLIGIRGRALNPEEVELVGKYMPVRIENTWYKHPLSLNLYGLYENANNIRANKYCIICESEKSVLQAELFQRTNCCVAACGSNFNKHQLMLLLKQCAPAEIIIAFDNEEIDGQKKYFNKLVDICKRYNSYCNMSFIYDRNGITGHKDSPTDKGQEIFERLLKERVKVK